MKPYSKCIGGSNRIYTRVGIHSSEKYVAIFRSCSQIHAQLKHHIALWGGKMQLLIETRGIQTCTHSGRTDTLAEWLVVMQLQRWIFSKKPQFNR